MGVVRYPCPPSVSVNAEIVPAVETVAVAKAGAISFCGWILILFWASLPWTVSNSLRWLNSGLVVLTLNTVPPTLTGLIKYAFGKIFGS